MNQANNEGNSDIMKWMSEHLEGLKSFITEAGDNFDEAIKVNHWLGITQRCSRELEVVKLLFAAGENIEAAPEEV